MSDNTGAKASNGKAANGRNHNGADAMSQTKNPQMKPVDDDTQLSDRTVLSDKTVLSKKPTAVSPAADGANNTAETAVTGTAATDDATQLSATAHVVPKKKPVGTAAAKTTTKTPRQGKRKVVRPSLPQRPGTAAKNPATTRSKASASSAPNTKQADTPTVPQQTVVQPAPSTAVRPQPISRPDNTALPAPDGEIAHFSQVFTDIVANIAKVIIGKETTIRQCVAALMVGGHILLEDNPGTGKTQLARGLANSIEAPFKRIQFTPDLLPSDVVGVTFYDQKTGEFTFREGPIFAATVLADEINRASPKTQSALLEVMEEQKVTVDGVTYPVPQPFIVIATQNPIEQLGTYKLPEAQLDRFLIKTSLGDPGHDASMQILREANIRDRANTVEPVASSEDILALRDIAEHVHADEAIEEYVVRLVEATRHNEKVMVGASMRGALALIRTARVWAAADGRGYVVPDDVKDLAVAVLAHRIILTAEATFAGANAQSVIADILDDVVAPTIGA